MPPAVLSKQECLRNATGKKKAVDQCRLSREGRLNPMSRCGGDEEGKVWVSAEENVQRVQRTKVFATGPEDPMHNRHKFHCMFRRVNVSMRARGNYEIKHPYESLNHLLQYQRYRENILYACCEGEGRQRFTWSTVYCREWAFCGLWDPQKEHKWLFHYDGIEWKPFLFTSNDDRVRSQNELLTTFLKVGGQWCRRFLEWSRDTDWQFSWDVWNQLESQTYQYKQLDIGLYCDIFLTC